VLYLLAADDDDDVGDFFLPLIFFFSSLFLNSATINSNREINLNNMQKYLSFSPLFVCVSGA
jgi:hypothetical protein